MQITLDEAKAAIKNACKMYLEQNPAQFQVTIGGQNVTIIFKRVANRLDFGFPNLYTLKAEDVDDLTVWWKQLYRGNHVLPPQLEPASGHYKINAVRYPSSKSGLTLNFHIPLTSLPKTDRRLNIVRPNIRQ